MLRENRPISDFIDGKYTFLNARLARHYGIQGVEGPDFRRVELTTDQRSGVFTQASVLTVSSYPTRTSVVLRGKYLLENVLNSPPPPPPADVPALDEAQVGVAKSLREQTRAASRRCRSARAATSRWIRWVSPSRTTTRSAVAHRGREVARSMSSGTLPSGKTFSGPNELKSLLKDRMPAFARSMSEKMLTYALGGESRGIDRAGRSWSRRCGWRRTSTGLQALIQGIVQKRAVPAAAW